MLSVIALFAIALLFIGDFEGRFERVFSTLGLFALFVLFTMLDTRRERDNSWYAPFAIMTNTYMLALLLIIIWITPYYFFNLMFAIFWQAVYVIVLTRMLLLCNDFLLRRALSTSPALHQWSQVAAVLSALAVVVFTVPLAFNAFEFSVPDLYWKFAVATLILAGLSIAVTLLLNSYVSSQQRQAAMRQAQPQYPAQQQQQQQPQPELLPWPTFADGSPYPMGADGQPDFAAAERLGR